MARKKRKQSHSSLPVTAGEVWEIGRRALDVHVEDLAQQGERPEMLLAVQVGESGGVVHVDAISSSTPPTALQDFVLQAMRQPMLGRPRRPEVIRVDSQAEAEILAVALADTGVAVEVTAELAGLDAVQKSMEAVFGNMNCDYRTRATQAGETLSTEGLRTFFRTARTFYREAIWEAYGDEVIFEITLQPAREAAKTLYGVLLGNLGEEFGLALYPSLDDFRCFYELSAEHLDLLDELPHDDDDEAEFDPEEWQEVADTTAQLLAVPSVTLTYSSESQTSPPLVQEAKQLKLSLANKSAFPLVLSTGRHSMQIATATELQDMFAAMRAILEWDKHIDDVIDEDEIDVTITSKLKAVPDFVPAMTVHATLQRNPCLPEEEEDDDWSPGSVDSLFETLLTESASDGKKSGKAASGKKTKVAQKATKTARSDRVYTLNVYLVQGPLEAAFAEQEISRLIDIRGDQTLHDLHRAIFDAFERWEEHLYEFNLGVGPADRSQLYFYSGGWDAEDEKGGNPETTDLDALGLKVGRRFGYTFDMGDQWEHIIEVVAVQKNSGKGSYPRLVKEVGKAPPQYPEDDEDV